MLILNKNKDLKLTEGIRHIIKSINPVYTEQEGSSIARLLVEHLGYKSGPVARIENKDLEEFEISQLEHWIKDLLTNKPVQYVLRYSWFMDRKIFVNENCLIPRQETEEIVLEILKNTEKTFSGNILDIGTGSGCISVSLAMELNFAQIFASDISKGALEVAQRNSFINNVNIEFLHDDVLDPDYSKFPAFDLIVSNPPYVRLLEREKMQSNVLDFEPSDALFVPDNDPLLFYKAIIEFSIKKLNKGGKLYLEINEVFGEEIKIVLHQNDFINITLIKDIHGKDRIIKAQKL